jgi:uncharacterized membrane protein YfbV (UPF0208 family)
MLSGFFMILFAGAYTLLYGLGKISKKGVYIKISYAFAVLQFLAAVMMCYPAFLDPFWKYIIMFSAVAYLFIPQGMWWVVHTSHTYWERQEKNKDT